MLSPQCADDRLQSKNDDLFSALASARRKADDNATALSEVFHHVAAKDAEVAALKAEVAALKMEKADAREAHAKQLLEAQSRGAIRAQVCPACTVTPSTCLRHGPSMRCACPREPVLKVRCLLSSAGRSRRAISAVVQATIKDNDKEAVLIDECRALTRCTSIAQ